MAQESSVRLYQAILSIWTFFVRHAPALGLGLLGLAAILAYVHRTDPRTVGSLRAWAGNRKRSLSILLTLFAMMVGSAALVELSRTVLARERTVRDATASRRDDPTLSGVSQYGPSVAIVQERDYLRTLTLPADVLDRLGPDGAGALAPYLGDTSTEGVKALRDTFVRSGSQVVLQRTVRRRDEVPLATDSASVNVRLRSRGDGARSTYVADFRGTYVFVNPRSTPAEIRFTFPLPLGGGTTEGFRLTVDGRRIAEPDQREQYAWSGVVPPKATIRAEATYRITGAGAFDYLLGSDRRRTAAFDMRVTSDRDLRFSRSGLFPTERSGGEATWRLRDVLTARSIGLVIPRSDDTRYLFAKSVALLPYWLGLFGISAWAVARERAARATLAVAVALALGPVLSGYVGPTVALVAGAIAAAGLGTIALGRKGAIVSVGVAALSLAFLSREHATAIAWAAAFGAIAALAVRRR